MGFMPANSVLLIDESSAALASRVGHGVSVSSFVEMNLKNTRKRNCVVVYMSAQDWEISASIRRNCREVWMPVPKDDLDVADSGHGGSGRPAENPDNFRLAWHVWDDYPYRKANLIEGPNPDDKGGFGPPTYTNRVESDIRFFMGHPQAMIGSDGNAISPDGLYKNFKPHPRFYGPYPRILGRYVRESPAVLTLEEAVYKMSGFPAERMGFKRRGRVEGGLIADLVLFDPENRHRQRHVRRPASIPNRDPLRLREGRAGDRRRTTHGRPSGPGA